MAKRLARKLSPATVAANLLKRLDVEGAPNEVVLYDIYGSTNKVTTGLTDKGEWLKFNGQFEAITSDGEILASGGCFLPEPMQSMLHAQLAQALEQDVNASVQFACRISIKAPPKGKPSSTGYEYHCIPLIEPEEEESPLAKLRALVGEKRQSLALPPETAKKTK